MATVEYSLVEAVLMFVDAESMMIMIRAIHNEYELKINKIY